jgi:glycosyltransferase involved in cell wall biosynthesis
VVCLHGQGADRIEQARRYAASIDLAVSVAKRVALQLEPIIGEAERVRHIPTGVPPPLQPARVRDSLQNLGYVGRLDQTEKRALDLIPLMRALRGVTLHVAGSGAEEATLRRELPDAMFHGAVPRRELYERVYPMLDALVILSQSEAGPIVAWEAMAHGVVPVVSDFIGRAEEGVIRDGETGVVFPPGDMRAAAAAIERLTAPGAMTQLSRAATALPHAYTLAGFEQAWMDALTRSVTMPLRVGAPADLPPIASSGRLARLPWLRPLLGRKFVHGDPGSEWPH